MGKFKDEHGKTRVGKFLEGVKDVAPDIVKAAGNITGIDALKNLGKMIDKSPDLTPEQKLSAQELLKLDIQEAQEVTKRWESDMASDSWLSKNVRPLVLLWLVLFMSLIMVSDSVEGWSFEVADAWISLLSTLLVTVIVAYFGSRGYEKGRSMKK